MSQLCSELTLRGKLKDLPRVIEFVETCCAGAGVGEAQQFEIVLAIEEACHNIFVHAYEGKAGELIVRLEAAGADLHITILDRGRRFNPQAVAAPNLSLPLAKRPVGGLGMHLMRELMDEVDYAFAATGNTLRMIKRGVFPADNGQRPLGCDGG